MRAGNNVIENKMGEKIAAWVWTCLDALGITTAVIAFINLEAVERAILFMASMIFFGYRVYHMHLDGEKKKIENEEKKFDLTEKKKPKIESK